MGGKEKRMEGATCTGATGGAKRRGGFFSRGA